MPPGDFSLEQMRSWCVEDENGCWIWQRGIRPEGYGTIWLPSIKKSEGSHRLMYMLAVGPIGAGLVLDHLCRNPPCANPEHLEPVTHTENVRRGLARNAHLRTHCVNGHLKTPEASTTCRGYWRCLICRRETDIRAGAKYRMRKRAERDAA